MCARLCVCVCVCACVRACVRACVCVRVCGLYLVSKWTSVPEFFELLFSFPSLGCSLFTLFSFRLLSYCVGYAYSYVYGKELPVPMDKQHLIAGNISILNQGSTSKRTISVKQIANESSFTHLLFKHAIVHAGSRR